MLRSMLFPLSWKEAEGGAGSPGIPRRRRRGQGPTWSFGDRRLEEGSGSWDSGWGHSWRPGPPAWSSGRSPGEDGWCWESRECRARRRQRRRAGSEAGAGRQPPLRARRKSGGRAEERLEATVVAAGGSVAPARSCPGARCPRGEGMGHGRARGETETRPFPAEPPAANAPRGAAGPGVSRISHTSGLAASWEIPKEGNKTPGTPLWWPRRRRCHSGGAWLGSEQGSSAVGWVWGFLCSFGCP